MSEQIKRALITLIAILGYGCWALYSNWPAAGITDSAAAEMIAIRAGIIQGSYSGLLTLVNIIALEALFLRCNDKLPCQLNMIVTVCIATIIQYSIIIPVHVLNQTPNIIITLLPGFIIGTAFSSVYLLSVRYKHYPKPSA